MRTASFPASIHCSTSPARARISARLVVWWVRLGRLRVSDPLALSTAVSKGGTAPLDWPKTTMQPRGANASRLFSKVLFPTES